MGPVSEGANAFSFERLHALEQARAAEARTQFAHEWTDFRPKALQGS